MLVEISTDFLFPELEIILVGEVFITEVLFYGTACPRLLLRLLVYHHLRNYILIFSIIFVFLCVW